MLHIGTEGFKYKTKFLQALPLSMDEGVAPKSIEEYNEPSNLKGREDPDSLVLVLDIEGVRGEGTPYEEKLDPIRAYGEIAKAILDNQGIAEFEADVELDVAGEDRAYLSAVKIDGVLYDRGNAFGNTDNVHTSEQTLINRAYTYDGDGVVVYIDDACDIVDVANRIIDKNPDYCHIISNGVSDGVTLHSFMQDARIPTHTTDVDPRRLGSGAAYKVCEAVYNKQYNSGLHTPGKEPSVIAVINEYSSIDNLFASHTAECQSEGYVFGYTRLDPTPTRELRERSRILDELSGAFTEPDNEYEDDGYRIDF